MIRARTIGVWLALPGLSSCNGLGRASCSGRPGDDRGNAPSSIGADPAAADAAASAKASTTDVAVHEHVEPRVAAGGARTCVVASDASLHCFGARYRHEEDGVLDAVTNVVQVAVAEDHACARRTKGDVTCWGAGEYGQLGDGSDVEYNWSGPTPMLDVRDAIEVTVAAGVTCVQGPVNAWRCWGRNDGGVVAVSGSWSKTAEPLRVSDVTQLAMSQRFFCARLVEGTATCWGASSSGELGLGTTAGGRYPPGKVRGLVDLRRIATANGGAGRHVCAVDEAGGVWCWGNNDDGQVGDGSTVTRSLPLKVRGLGRAADVAVGVAHTCARLVDGSVWCWGAGDRGQLGVLAPKGRTTPTKVTSLSGVLEIVAGDAHTCVRTETTISCFGANGEGQLGDGTTVDHFEPVRVVLTPSL